jgi:hypothetical protein
MTREIGLASFYLSVIFANPSVSLAAMPSSTDADGFFVVMTAIFFFDTMLVSLALSLSSSELTLSNNRGGMDKVSIMNSPKQQEMQTKFKQTSSSTSLGFTDKSSSYPFVVRAQSCL